MSCFSAIELRILVYDITICIMLDNETAAIVPVIKDLGAVDVSANSPHELVSILGQPLMALFDADVSVSLYSRIRACLEIPSRSMAR